MTSVRKAWYVVYSALVVLGSGWGIGSFVADLYRSDVMPQAWHLPCVVLFWPLAVLIWTALLCLQWRRITWSIARTKGVAEWSPTTRFWSLDLNPQVLALVAVWAFVGLPGYIFWQFRPSPQRETLPDPPATPLVWKGFPFHDPRHEDALRNAPGQKDRSSATKEK